MSKGDTRSQDYSLDGDDIRIIMRIHFPYPPPPSSTSKMSKILRGLELRVSE